MSDLKLVAVLLSLFIQRESIAYETMYNELSADELKFMAQSIRAVEDSLLNVRIDSNAWVEKGPSSSGPWERTPICFSTTAFFGNISSNKSRIDFHRDISRREKGTDSYIEESYSVGFDGIQGRRKEILSTFGGKTFHRNSGVITSDAPLQLRNCNRITGIGASLFFYYRNMPDPFPKRFSANFEAAADPNSFLSALAAANPKYLNVKPLKHNVVIEELGGIQCIKMSCTENSFRQEWWLDPNRGFALLKFVDLRKDKDGNEQLKSSINVTNLKEVAKDIWWPMEAYFVDGNKRIVYQASNVIVNDPNIDNSVFTINFPRDCKVDDTVNGKNYIVDANLTMIAEPNYSPHFKTIRQNDGGPLLKTRRGR